MMNLSKIVGIALLSLCFILYYRGIRLSDTSNTHVLLSQETTFAAPKDCRRLALLGCTPHPTDYLENEATPKKMCHLTLEELLDLDDLEDSFRQVLHLCVKNKIDHLLIAYLPIYFVKMRMLTRKNFVEQSQDFLTTIAPQMAHFITMLAKKEQITLPITLVIPSREALEKVPSTLVSKEDRVRYLIKQLPKIVLNNTNTLSIINNKGSSQNEGIIRYLKYEYLFDKPITYETYETSKKRFHKYIQHNQNHHLTLLKQHKEELKENYQVSSGWTDSIKAGSLVAAKEPHIRGCKALIKSLFIV